MWLLALLYVIVAGTPFLDMGRRQEQLLRALNEVVSGPAQGQLLVLHLDAVLPTDLLEAVMQSLQFTSHIILSFRNNHNWPTDEALTLFHYKKPLHILIWFTPSPELLQSFCYYWKPQSLLFLSLGSTSATSLLREEALHIVKNVVSLESLPVAGNNSDSIGVFTRFPFSSGSETFLGYWRRDTFGSWIALFPNRFSVFEGYTFHISTWFNDIPFLYGDELKPKGAMIKVLEIFSAKLNFTYTLTLKSPDLKWGATVNGSWNGVLGMIAKKEKNFTINSFMITSERMQAFDSSAIVIIDRISVLLLSPQQLPKWLSIFRPFSPAVLVFFASIIAILSISLALKVRTHTHTHTHTHHLHGSVVDVLACTQKGVDSILLRSLNIFH